MQVMMKTVEPLNVVNLFQPSVHQRMIIKPTNKLMSPTKTQVFDYLNTNAPASATIRHLCQFFDTSNVKLIIDELVGEGKVFYSEPVETDTGTILPIRTYQRQQEIEDYKDGGVLINKCDPPLISASKSCGAIAMAIYAFLWESASKDINYDKRLHLDWKSRRDTGGTTTWSIKGIADALGLTRKTAKSAIDKLLDNGFIQHINKCDSSKGKYHSVFRVTHPIHLTSVRYANDVMGGQPSKNRTKLLNSIYNDDIEYDGYYSSYDERLEQMIDDEMVSG